MDIDPRPENGPEVNSVRDAGRLSGSSAGERPSPGEFAAASMAPGTEQRAVTSFVIITHAYALRCTAVTESLPS